MGPTILSIATAALGIATLVYLQSAGAGTSFQTQVESCMKDPYTKANENYYKVDVKALDTFFCFITPFFQGATSGISGIFALNLLTTVFIFVLVFSGIEASRTGNTIPKLLLPLLMLLVQVLGISVVVPLMILPLYWFTTMGAGEKGLESGSILGVVGAIVFLFLPFTALFVVPKNLESLFIFLFNLAPIFASACMFLPLVSTLLGLPFAGALGSKSGSETAKSVYLFFSGICTLFWIIGSIQVISWYLSSPNPTLDEFTRGYFAFSDNAGFAAHFLIVDFVVLYASLVVAVYYESGTGETVDVVVRGVLLSPGAAFCLWRARLLTGKNKAD